MSCWTYVTGVINVRPMGETQPEKRYILDTVLAHLPRVTGSEEDMKVSAIEGFFFDSSTTHNEFGEPISGWPGRAKITETYHIIVSGYFRDRMFDETLREFNKWLNRLAKRVMVKDICVKVYDHYGNSYVFSNPDPYYDMLEEPSWISGGKTEPAWPEYLLWERAKDSRYPMLLEYKYVNNPENDAEVERRMRYSNGEQKIPPLD